MTTTDLSQLASDLARDGFAGHDVAIRDVVRTARARGISPVLASLLADDREPEVARLRAFGAVATALATETHEVARPAA